jgi:hypothetical protein
MRRCRWFSICGMAIGIGLLTACMSTGYRSATYYPDGRLKSSRHVYNATVWHEALKSTFNSAVEGVADFAGSPLGIAALSTIGLGGAGVLVRQHGKGKEKSYNKGIQLGAKLQAGVA